MRLEELSRSSRCLRAAGRTTEFLRVVCRCRNLLARPVVHAKHERRLDSFASPFSPSSTSAAPSSPPKVPTHDPRPLFLVVRARQSPWQLDLPAIAFPQILGRRPCEFT